jgi:amidohydrolase
MTAIAEQAQSFAADLVRWRRDFHEHPELAFQEHRTSERIRAALSDLPLEVRSPVARTGIVAVLRGARPGRRVALRADMDALPVEEQTHQPYRSKTPGVAHACGHDAHMAMLIGAARLLASRRDSLSGEIVFLFQPSEEVLPGGAPLMIAEGALDGVAEIFGLHVLPLLPVGCVGLRSGAAMASPSDLTFVIEGKGGHAALPHHAVDPIQIAAQVVLALQTLVSRRTDPLDSVVLSITSIRGGEGYNVIPPQVELKGTLRTLSTEGRERLDREILALARGIVEGQGGKLQFQHERGYPVLRNHPSSVARVAKVASSSLRVVDGFPPVMAGEDFAYYLEKVPGAFAFLGCAGAGMPCFINHHPSFDLDERCLPLGAELLAGLALDSAADGRGTG